jgi:hypothetical protein
MAPPAKKKQKSATGVAVAVPDEAAGPSPPALALTVLNGGHLKALDDAEAAMKKHKTFKDFSSLPPLGIGHGGTQEPFDPIKFKTSIEKEGSYVCGDSIGKIDFMHSYEPAVPKNIGQIDKMRTRYYSQAQPWAFVIHVAVPSKEYNPLQHLGSLVSLSPEEIYQPWKLEVALRIQAADGKEDEALLKEYLKYARCVIFKYELIETEEESKARAMALREDFAAKHELLSRTPYQRLMSVVAMVDEQERKCPAGKIAAKVVEVYGKASISADREQVSESYVKAAVELRGAMTAAPSISDDLKYCDEKWAHESPFRSVHTLSVINSRAKSPQKCSQVISLIVDQVRCGSLASSSVTERNCNGKSTPSLVDQALKKFDLTEHLLVTHASKYCARAQVISALRTAFASTEAYRDLIESCEGTPRDLAWMGPAWSHSENLLMAFIAKVKMGTVFDQSIRTGIKNRKSTEEMLEYGIFQEQIEEITSAAKAEAVARNASQDSVTKDSVTKDSVKDSDSTEAVDSTAASIDGSTTSWLGDFAKVPKTLETLDLEKQQYWLAFGTRTIDSICELISIPATQSQLSERISVSRLAALRGVAGSDCVMIMLNQPMTGEAATSPHTRVAPLRDDIHARLVNGTLDARRKLSQDKRMLIEGDVLAVTDGGRHGNFPKLRKPLEDERGRADDIDHLQVHEFYDEQSYAARLGLVRGFHALHLVEHMHLFSVNGLQIPTRSRDQYPGFTNKSDIMGPIVFPSLQDSWVLSYEQKKELYGKYRRAVGGQDPSIKKADDDEIPKGAELIQTSTTVPPDVAGNKGDERAPSRMEPVFYRAMPFTLACEVVRSYCVKGSIHLSVGDGALALAHVRYGKPFFGVCLSDVHRTKVRQHLIIKCLEMFRTEDSGMYQPPFGVLFSPSTVPPPPKPKPKPKPKKSPKKSSDESSSSSEESGKSM